MTDGFSISGGASAAASFWLKGVAAAWLAMLLALAFELSPLWAPGLFHGMPLLLQDLIRAPLSWFFSLMVAGALYRRALAPDAAQARRLGLGFGGLQFGRPELRLLGASVLFWLVAGGVWLLVFLILGLACLALGLNIERTIDLQNLAQTIAGTATWKLWILAVIATLGLLLEFYVVVRAILYRAATVAEGRMVFLESFRLTAGRVVPLTVLLVLVSLPGLGSFLCQALGFGPWPPLLSRVQDGLPLTSGLAVFITVQALIRVFVQTPLAVGLFSYAYQTLKPAPA
jgi:hypothetical protein